MMQLLNYGRLPEYEQFEMAFKSRHPNGIYQIRGYPELNALYPPNGDVDLTMEQTWNALKQCSRSWKNNHELGDVGEKILNSLGFEWI